MKKVMMTIAVLAGITATAQVKVGANPTTLATNATLQVEGTTTSQQFVVLNSGNVGINTLTPSVALDIYKLNINGIVTVAKLGVGGNGGNGRGVGLLFASGGDSTAGFPKVDVAQIVGMNNIVSSIPAKAALMFQIAEPVAGVLTERMRITENGNVGIGTTTPSQKLHVVGNIQMVDGNEGTGKVMVSDAAGKGTWTTLNTNTVNATATAAGTTIQTVVGGNTEHTTAGAGVIMTASDGQWKLTIGAGGVVTVTKVL